MKEPTDLSVDEYIAAHGDWSRAATLHWELAQQRLEGIEVSAAELRTTSAELNRAHQRLLAAVDQL